MEKLWDFVHLIGLIFGAGSVTTAYARELYFQLHPQEAQNRGSLRVVSTMINIGFALLIISGFGLYLSTPVKFNNSPYFLVKMALVLLLLVNHVAINAFIRDNKHELKIVHTLSEYFSLLGWYLIIALSIWL